MLSVLLSVLCGAAVGCAFGLPGVAAPAWAAVWGVLAAFFAMVGISFVLRRKIAAETGAMQAEMGERLKRLQARVNDWQHHPRGDARAFAESMQRNQADIIRDALARTDGLRRFARWIPLFDRQMAAMKVQLLWQLKDFAKVDELLPKCFVVDPFTASIKLARQFMKDDGLAAMEKTYRKARARLRYNQSALLSAVMSWIYVKRGKIDEAYALLEKACRDNNTDSAPGSILLKNRDALANNRTSHFSNAGLGDQWYALFLEEPRFRPERRAPSRFGKFG